MAKPLPWLVPAVITGATVPLAVLGLEAVTGRLGANPVSVALNQLGLLSLITLLGALSLTPLKLVTGWTWPVRIRRTVGLIAFGYVCLHFTTYALLDQGLDVAAILADVTKRGFTVVGFTALLLLTPLAITSTDRMVRRLGYVRWKRLHRLAYVAGVLGVVHFIWRVKKDKTEPYVYAAILGLLFLLRGLDTLRKARATRAPPAARAR